VQANGGASTELIQPEEMVQDVDFRGLSLQAFVDGEEQDPMRSIDVHSYSARSIEECMSILLPILKCCELMTFSDDREKEKFEDLHKSISVSC
jgi:hypothetical protein